MSVPRTPRLSTLDGHDAVVHEDGIVGTVWCGSNQWRR